MAKPRLFVILSVVVLIALLATSCAQPTPQPTTAPAPAAPTSAPTVPLTEAATPAEPAATVAATVPSAPTAPAAAQPTGEPIKIGVINPLTGVYANMGQETTRGARIAAQYINSQGGLLGRPVELIERDDKQNTQEGAKQAEELITNEKVDVITGCRSGSVTLAINEVTKRAGTLYFGECQTNHLNDANADFGPYTFHFDTTLWWQNQAVLPWVTENLGSKIYVLYADYAWGKDNLDSVQAWLEANGVEPVGVEKTPVGTTDYSAVIPKIRAAKPDVLYAAVAGADHIALVKQAKSFGLFNEMKIIFPIMDMAFDRELGFENLDPNLYGVGLFYWENQDQYPSVKQFVDLYSKEYNAPPGGYATQQFVAIMAWYEAAKKAGSLDKDAITEAAEGMELDYGVGPSFVRECDHQWFMPLVVARGRTAEDAKDIQPWPDEAFREVVAVIDPDEKYERSCEDLGHKSE